MTRRIYYNLGGKKSPWKLPEDDLYRDDYRALKKGVSRALKEGLIKGITITEDGGMYTVGLGAFGATGAGMSSFIGEAILRAVKDAKRSAMQASDDITKYLGGLRVASGVRMSPNSRSYYDVLQRGVEKLAALGIDLDASDFQWKASVSRPEAQRQIKELLALREQARVKSAGVPKAEWPYKMVYAEATNIINELRQRTEITTRQARTKTKNDFQRTSRIEDDTAILPGVVAESVVHEVVAFLTKNDLDDLAGTLYRDQQKFIKALWKKAQEVYTKNSDFKKKIRQRGNKGRDSLYSFMRHWLVDLFNKSPSYRQLNGVLPSSYAMGRALTAGLPLGKGDLQGDVSSLQNAIQKLNRRGIEVTIGEGTIAAVKVTVSSMGWTISSQHRYSVTNALRNALQGLQKSFDQYIEDWRSALDGILVSRARTAGTYTSNDTIFENAIKALSRRGITVNVSTNGRFYSADIKAWGWTAMSRATTPSRAVKQGLETLSLHVANYFQDWISTFDTINKVSPP